MPEDEYLTKADFAAFERRYYADSTEIKHALQGDLDGTRPGIVPRVAEAERKLSTITRIVWITFGALAAALINDLAQLVLTGGG